MRILLKTFVIVWLLMFSHPVTAQKKSFEFTGKSRIFYYSKQNAQTIFPAPGMNIKAVPGGNEVQALFNNRIIKPSLYCSQLGFFCKNELKLDKLTVVPVRFRLGSLDYVNWMERKPNSGRPLH